MGNHPSIVSVFASFWHEFLKPDPIAWTCVRCDVDRRQYTVALRIIDLLPPFQDFAPRRTFTIEGDSPLRSARIEQAL